VWLTTASFLDGDGFFGSTMTTASHLGDEGLGSELASASFSTSGSGHGRLRFGLDIFYFKN
jgi:hypothetical protein